MEENKEEKKTKKKKYRGLRIFGKIILGLFVFIFLLLLFIRSPWGQDIIKDKLITYITDKTNTTVEVDRLFITFSGNIYLDGLYLEDKQGDTLIYSRELEADIPLLPIIQGEGFAINSLDWDGVRANIIRKDTIEGFNFSFLAEAFATQDTTTTTTAQDTTASQNFRIGDISLTNFNVTYNDAVVGAESQFIVGQLELEMEDVDMENMRFSASEGYIANSQVNYRIIPYEADPDAEAPPMPHLIIDDLELENVLVNFESVPDQMLAQIDIQELLLELPGANFEENNFNINNLVLNNSEVFIKTKASNEIEAEEATAETINNEFQWPELNLLIDEISLNDNNFTFINNDVEINHSAFDANAVEVLNLDLEATNIVFQHKEVGANVQSLSFTETSGINLNELQFQASFDNNNLSLQDLVLNLNDNTIRGDVAAAYSSIESFIENPESTTLDANLPQFNVSLKDLFVIQPDLANNEYLNTLSQRRIRGKLRADGTLENIDIPILNVKWGTTTSLVASGSISNPTEPENMRFNFPRINAVSTRNDIVKFIDEEQLGISLPQRLALTAKVQGNMEDIDAVARLNTSQGLIALDGNFSSSDGIAFNADMQVTDLELGKIMNNEQFGNLNLTLTASAEGANINTLDASIDATVESFDYNNYPIRDLDITGELEDGSGLITMDYEDGNLNMDMESYVELDSVAPLVNMNLNVTGANLQSLGFATKDIRVGFELDGSFKGNLENFDANAEIVDGVAVHDQSSYLLGDFELSARVRPDSTAMDIRNQIVDLNLRSNTDPTRFINGLQRHYQSYFEDDVYSDTIQNPVDIEMRAQVREHPILTEVFFTSLEELDTVRVAVDFHERQRSLTATVDAPHVNYMGNEIDSLDLSVNSTRNDFDFILGFKNLDAGPLAIQETDLSGEIIDNELHIDFNSYYEEETLLSIHTEAAQRNDSIYLHVDPSELILNSENWQIPATNQIVIAENLTGFTDFLLSRNNQSLRVSNSTDNNIEIEFDGFELASILSYLNPEQPLASGNLNGDLIIEEPYGSTGLDAGVQISNFNVMEVPLGNLTLNAENTTGNDYAFDMAINGGNIDLDLTGGFYATEAGARWDTELDLNEVQMAVVEGFSMGEITETSGSFSGNIDLAGTFAEPEYEGSLNFNNAAFTVATLNAAFELPNETLQLDNEGIYLDDFDLQDENNNMLTLNGEVLTENLLNPTFDLAFEADNFTLLNSTSEDNELYYGTAIVDVDGTLGGDLNLPRVDLNLVVDSETDLTYVIPPSEVGIEERKGVVIFVNKENPDAILTAAEEDAFTLTGFAINSIITINEDAVLNVIVNEETGDNLQVIGEGDLNFNIYANGRTTLSGRYEMSGGHYEMSLYNLVNRRFEIVEGSSISWSGDPLDASLDVRARYRVETSASSLMAAQTSGADTQIRSQYQQELPFFVYLNVDGELMSPLLTFGLDMPEDEQGAIGGEVYGKIQQLNNQEQELNKQVFSLLVLNRFYPEGTNDGSNGGTMAIARDNLNSALSDQLNLLSNNLLGDSGFELNFGLDSFTDYQGDSPTERTQLDIAAEKTFLDERLVVSVGSEVDIQGSSQDPQQENPLIGNVSIEYLLTENGRYRLRGFRRNTFENVVDGQVIISGIALIFTREFNKFNELWGNLREDEEQTAE